MKISRHFNKIKTALKKLTFGWYLVQGKGKLFMITFTAVIKRFDKQGEKTGWTYIEIPSDIADKIMP
ncbi:MAG: hypothetical protein ACM3H8_10810, partial [Sphingobacteriales bacterium]